MASEKLQKVLARAGLGSRRQIEAWIKAGRVKVNNSIATIGDRVTAKARVAVDEQEVVLTVATKLKTRVLLYYKPLGEICTRADSKGRPTVFRNLPKLTTGRWIAVGRLDINSEGLLLFTNDGELANVLMHPRFAVEREYLVRVFGEVTPALIHELQAGIELEDGRARFTKIRKTGGKGLNQWFKVVITEGRNRLVRRLWNAKKIAVNRLIRLRFYDILLPRSLKPGGIQELGTGKVELLRKVMENK